MGTGIFFAKEDNCLNSLFCVKKSTSKATSLPYTCTLDIQFVQGPLSPF